VTAATALHAPMPTFHRCESGLSIGQKAVGYPQQHAAETRRSLILTEAVAARQVFSASQPCAPYTLWSRMPSMCQRAFGLADRAHETNILAGSARCGLPPGYR